MATAKKRTTKKRAQQAAPRKKATTRKKTAASPKPKAAPRARAPKRISDSQRDVVEAYLADPARNKSAAYRKVHQNVSTGAAWSKGYQMFLLPHVQAYLEKRQKEIAATLRVTPEKVIAGVAEIAFADRIGNTGVAPRTRLAALKLLHDHLGLGVDPVVKHEHSGPDGGPVPVCISSDMPEEEAARLYQQVIRGPVGSGA